MSRLLRLGTGAAAGLAAGAAYFASRTPRRCDAHGSEPAGTQSGWNRTSAIPSLCVALALAPEEGESDVARMKSAFGVPAGPVEEPFTGFTFPEDITVPGGGDGAGNGRVQLAGVSIRCMLGYCQYAAARAYAYALYVDGGDEQAEALRSSGASSADDAALYEAAIAMPGSKAICLKFAREMPPAHIAKGFDRTLVKLVRLEHNGTRKNTSKPALRELINYFSKAKAFRAGSQVVFAVSSDGTQLTTVLDGEVKGTIKDPQLCRAVLGMYLGPRAVSKAGRKVMGEGLLAFAASQNSE